MTSFNAVATPVGCICTVDADAEIFVCIVLILTICFLAHVASGPLPLDVSTIQLFLFYVAKAGNIHK